MALVGTIHTSSSRVFRQHYNRTTKKNILIPQFNLLPCSIIQSLPFIDTQTRAVGCCRRPIYSQSRFSNRLRCCVHLVFKKRAQHQPKWHALILLNTSFIICTPTDIHAHQLLIVKKNENVGV